MWFDKFPERFREESGILTGRGFVRDDVHFNDHKSVRFEGYSTVEPARKLVVCFPDAFPSFPPEVFDTNQFELLSRHHRWDSRQLCLFGLRKSRWHARLSVADALDEADSLIASYGPGTVLPNDDWVPEPTSDALTYGASRAVFVPPPISTLEVGGSEPVNGTFELQFGRPVNGKTRGVVTAATLGSQPYKADARYTSLCGEVSRTVHGTLLYFPGMLTQKEVYETVGQHLSKLDAAKRKKGPMLALVFPEQSGNAANRRLGWVFATIRPDGNPELIRAFPYDHDDRAARIPGLAGIGAARIAFIGCGCLGSRIAVSLAASGLGSVTLVDGDVYEPYNSVRHEVGVPSFGLGKAEALSQRLFEVNPALRGRVETVQHHVGHVNTAQVEQEIARRLAEADLLIDTTGSHAVSRWLNEQAFEMGKPAIFASVTNGAWAGEIVRVVPGRTACWLCWDAQYRATPPPSAPTVGFFPPGCNQPSFVGTTYDAAVVAGFASSMAVDTLLHQAATLPGFPHDYVRWEGRDHAGALAMKSEILPIKQREGCSTCHAR